MSISKKYIIEFGIEKKDKGDVHRPKQEILENNIDIIGTFEFYDHNSNSTIGYLKEYFLTNFGKKYPGCKCLLFLYYKTSQVFGSTKYNLFDELDNKKLVDFNYSNIYLIQIDSKCHCQLKNYNKYMNIL